MKSLLIAVLVATALAGGHIRWDLPDSLPSCYTSLPFSFSLTPGYIYKSVDIPTWAIINQDKGIITGQYEKAGAWPFTLVVADGKGNSVNKQYIINVIDSNSAEHDLWSRSSNNYYSRKVQNPFRIIANHAISTVVQVGNKFSYSFKTENHVGSPVFAFLNLPDGLVGDAKSGIVSGAFSVPGIYTLGVESADQSGNTAEGFVTITCGEVGLGSLNKITVANQVPFVYNIDTIQRQQVEADKQLFAALNSVNNAKAEVAARQGIYDGINTRLAGAEAAADKAAASASRANTDRENAANRLTQTNRALNDA
jgi:hypothetical protein